LPVRNKYFLAGAFVPGTYVASGQHSGQVDIYKKVSKKPQLSAI